MSHTPGPYSVGGLQQNVRISGYRIVGCGATVAIVVAGTGKAEATSNLLAAAPDLLEACQVTLRLMRENGHTHEAPKQHADFDILDQFDTGLSSPLSAVLESAIAKAGGAS